MSGALRRISEPLIRQQRHLLLRESWLDNGGVSAMQVRHWKNVQRRIQVILTERIKHVGEAGEIVDVAPGYARNYLCPQLKAMPAIPKYIALVRQNLEFWPPPPVDHEAIETESKEKEDAEKQKEIDKMLQRLISKKVVVWGIAIDKTNLRFPIPAATVAAEVRRQLHIDLTEAHIDLSQELTTLGEVEVPIRLPPGLPLPGGKERLHLKVRVRRKNRVHNTQTVLPKTGVLHPRYVNPDGTLKAVPDKRDKRPNKTAV